MIERHGLGPSCSKRIQKAERTDASVRSNHRLLIPRHLDSKHRLYAGAALAAIMTLNCYGTVFYGRRCGSGFAIKVIADNQKMLKADPANENKFIATGICVKRSIRTTSVKYCCGPVCGHGPSLSQPQCDDFLISPVFVNRVTDSNKRVPPRKTAGARWGDDQDIRPI